MGVCPLACLTGLVRRAVGGLSLSGSLARLTVRPPSSATRRRSCRAEGPKTAEQTAHHARGTRIRQLRDGIGELYEQVCAELCCLRSQFRRRRGGRPQVQTQQARNGHFGRHFGPFAHSAAGSGRCRQLRDNRVRAPGAAAGNRLLPEPTRLRARRLDPRTREKSQKTVARAHQSCDQPAKSAERLHGCAPVRMNMQSDGHFATALVRPRARQRSRTPEVARRRRAGTDSKTRRSARIVRT
jgi:hypothetical protein